MNLNVAEHKKLADLKKRIYELGFFEKGITDLKKMAEKEKSSALKWAAVYELALWHANQRTEVDAQQCLNNLPWLRENFLGENVVSLSILETESLQLLNDVKKAKRLILSSLSSNAPRDLFLAMANLEHSLFAKAMWINKAFKDEALEPIDLFTNQSSNLKGSVEEREKVSVIVPILDTGTECLDSLNSLLNQTYSNMEILLVHGSNEKTVSMLKPLGDKDARIKLINSEKMDCLYALCNLGLSYTTGEFATIHLVNTWSHPQKIELVVADMISKPSIMAVVPYAVEVEKDFSLVRQLTGSYRIIDYASFMFRRHPVMDKLGYLDCVQSFGPEEYLLRIKRAFGDDSIAFNSKELLSFQFSSGELSGYLMGAKKEYLDSAQFYYKNTESLYYNFPQSFRPFAAPNPLLNKEGDNNSHYDFIIASDFRFPGGTSSSNAEEIKAQRTLGKTGLVQISRYPMPTDTEMNFKIRELIDGEQVQMIVPGERVSCDVLIVKHPSILEYRQEYIPKIKAKRVFVIINQTPLQKYGSEGRVEYNILNCAKNCEAYFGTTGIWYPISPGVREILHQYHSKELEHIDLAKEDWFEIIDVHNWTRASRPQRGGVLKVGRHSRDQYEKWPWDPEELLSIYPDKGCEVHILGGAQGPIKTLGKLPDNWTVIPFGEKHPKDFLKELDVFIYYTHPDLIEAFGRVIIEAMAAGVPVILPYHFQKLFGEAAIYAEPRQVQARVKDLMENDKYYERQVELALDYVERHFGYSKHASRLGK